MFIFYNFEDNKYSYMPYLFSISVSLSTLFVALLLSIKEKKATHYLLATFFLLASIQVSSLMAFYLGGEFFYLPVLSEVNTTIPILYAGLIFFYAKAAIQPDFNLSEKLALPLCGYMLYLLVYSYVFHLPNELNQIWLKFIHSLKPIVNIIIIIRLIFFINRVEKSGYWRTKKQFRRWLYWLVFGGLIICSMSLVGMIIHYFNPELAVACGDYYIGSFLSIYFFSLVFVAFKNPKVFLGKWMPQSFNKIAKGSDFSLNFDAENLLFKELIFFMETQKPFLDAQLSLSKLADLQNLPVSKLSRLINQYGSTTFFDFVNKYRIEEVKNKIQDSQYDHLSLLGITLDSGFNSKASFNRTFKKMVGMTPSAYRKEILMK